MSSAQTRRYSRSVPRASDSIHVSGAVTTGLSTSRHAADSIHVSDAATVGVSAVRHAADSIQIGEATTVHTGRASGGARAFGSAVESYAVGRAKVDRRPQVGLALGGAGLGGPFGEHALHGPWLLRWGAGAALGAAIAAWLWDSLRSR